MIQNRYLIVQMIGKGGMGEVYLAVDQRLGSAVALKRTMFHENPELGNAFEREAKILGRLRHPVLPKVIDHFVESSEQYLVMEHISGDDLGKRLESAKKPFPLSWVMFWADQLLDALNYLHSHEPPIIHRDIKPENLKLTDDNHIVLLDFGLSKDFDTKADTSSLGTGSVVGYSPYFASMEQVRGTGTDARSDIYSLSATLYQLLTNVVPVDALTRADALLGGLQDPIQAPFEINREVTPGISDVILKGIAVRQNERYDKASEMQRALRRAFNRSGAGDQSPEAEKTPMLTGEGQTKIIPVMSTQPSESPDQVSATRIAEDVRTEESLGAETLHFDAPAADPEPIQADIKTQIFAAPGAEEPAGQAEQITSEFQSESVAAPATFAAAAGAEPPTQLHEQPPQLAQPPKKKSRAGLVVGVLLGLLVLAGIAAGGGWYAYNKYYLPSQVKESPTPTPEIKASPSPQPTESVVIANSNSGVNSNANVAQTDNINSTETNSSRVVVSPPPDARQTPQSVSKNPPVQTTKPPAVKATPRAKGKDDRTVIIQ